MKTSLRMFSKIMCLQTLPVIITNFKNILKTFIRKKMMEVKQYSNVIFGGHVCKAKIVLMNLMNLKILREDCNKSGLLVEGGGY